LDFWGLWIELLAHLSEEFVTNLAGLYYTFEVKYVKGIRLTCAKIKITPESRKLGGLPLKSAEAAD
jgi:hypothetical protein